MATLKPRGAILLGAAIAAVMGANAGPPIPDRRRDMEPVPDPERKGKTRYRVSQPGLNPEKEERRQRTNDRIKAQRADPNSINEKYLSAHERRRRRAARNAAKGDGNG
jgi:hypothetical protein